MHIDASEHDFVGFGLEELEDGQIVDRRPIFEPGNMMGCSDFETYYTAVVIMPQIRKKEAEFSELLEFLRKGYFKALVHDDSVLAEKLLSEVKKLKLLLESNSD